MIVFGKCSVSVCKVSFTHNHIADGAVFWLGLHVVLPFDQLTFWLFGSVLWTGSGLVRSFIWTDGQGLYCSRSWCVFVQTLRLLGVTKSLVLLPAIISK